MKEQTILVSVPVIARKDGAKIRWFIVKQSDENGWELPKVVVRKVESSVRAAIRSVSEQGGMRSQVYEVCACYCEIDGKFLLLLRQDHKPQGNTWCLPAGKVDEGEDVYSAIVREVREETGMDLSKGSVEFIMPFYVSHEGYSFIYQVFKSLVDSSDVIINPKEHKEYKWTTPKEALSIQNLMPDEDECIRICYGIK